MLKNPKNVRSKYWVDRSTQRRIIQDFVTLLGIGCLLVYIFPVCISLLFGIYFTEMPLAEIWQQISDAIWMPLLTLLLLLPLGMRHCIRFSNRIAGPMLRFQTETRNLLDGKPVETVVLRKKDFFQPFAAEFNQLLELVEDYRHQLEQKRPQPNPPQALKQQDCGYESDAPLMTDVISSAQFH